MDGCELFRNLEFYSFFQFIHDSLTIKPGITLDNCHIMQVIVKEITFAKR